MDNIQKSAPGRARPPRSEADRKAGWIKNLHEIGGFTDEKFCQMLADYAAKNRGYDPTKYWGSSLVVMFNRLAKRLRDKLEVFQPEDAEYGVTKLLEFLQQKPLGNTVVSWRTNFATNGDQRTAVNKFFGCDRALREIGRQDRVLLQLRDAAWPSLKEEANNTGGSFAERFHYLATAVARFGTLEGGCELMFKDCFHDSPLPTYEGYGHRENQSREPSWIHGDKCECGCDLTKDEDGNTICSNPLCGHNIAAVATTDDFGKAFRSQPMPAERPPKGRRDGSDHRHRRDDDGDERFSKKNRKKGPKFRENTDEIDDTPGDAGDGEPTVAATATPANLGSLGDALEKAGIA